MKTFVFLALLCVFSYLAFVPPEGMKKFPSARVEFRVDTDFGEINAQLGPNKSDQDHTEQE